MVAVLEAQVVPVELPVKEAGEVDLVVAADLAVPVVPAVASLAVKMAGSDCKK